jgi:hypothetical protein
MAACYGFETTAGILPCVDFQALSKCYCNAYIYIYSMDPKVFQTDSRMWNTI